MLSVFDKWSYMSTTMLVLLVLLAAGLAECSQDAAGPNQLGKARLGPSTRTVLAEIAREMVARTATNSQVLSLNLTNLLILLVLKALLFGAGLFSFGMLKGGRSEPAYPSLGESELLLLLSYLVGDAARKYDCLHRVACEEPKQAREYVAGAGMLLKGARIFSKVVPYNPRYETIVADVQKAVEFGLGGGECAARYSCTKPS